MQALIGNGKKMKMEIAGQGKKTDGAKESPGNAVCCLFHVYLNCNLCSQLQPCSDI